MLPGSITDELVDRPEGDKAEIRLEHPSGKIDLVLELSHDNFSLHVKRAGLIRTARKLFRGELYVPSRIWSQAKHLAS